MAVSEVVGLPFEILEGGYPRVNGARTLGHPVKLTDDVIDEVVRYVEAGNYLQVAFAAAGCHSASWTKWKDQGYKVRERFPDLDLDEYPPDLIPPDTTPSEWQSFKLLTRMLKAEARAEAHAVLQVRKHMPDQWTAAMTYLERRFPERWRRRQTIEAVDGGSVADLDEQALIEDPQALEALHDALEHVARRKAPELPSGDM